MIQPNRGWTDEEWDAAEARLVELLRPVADEIVASKAVPIPNPMGVSNDTATG